MIVGIVGSRGFTDEAFMEQMVEDAVGIENIDCIVSGGAKGADSLGERLAIKHNIPTIIYKPNWLKYGKSAGMIRNKEIVEASDVVIAFWDGESKGTMNTIQTCMKQGVTHHIFTF